MDGSGWMDLAKKLLVLCNGMNGMDPFHYWWTQRIEKTQSTPPSFSTMMSKTGLFFVYLIDTKLCCMRVCFDLLAKKLKHVVRRSGTDMIYWWTFLLDWMRTLRLHHYHFFSRWSKTGWFRRVSVVLLLLHTYTVVLDDKWIDDISCSEETQLFSHTFINDK